MVQLVRAIVGIASVVLRLGVLFLRSSSAIRAENLVLRKQLVSYFERGVKPRRVDHATRISLALFTRLFDCCDAVVNVQPRNHRWLAPTGLEDLLALDEQGGPTTDSFELHDLIRGMAADNPLWREERIANWVTHYNGGRSHSALGPGVPDPPKSQEVPKLESRHRLAADALVLVASVLGGLHHEYSLGKVQSNT
jgi:hypothetical protein